MAKKWSWTVNGTSPWADSTEQTISSVAARVTKIEIFPNADQSAIAYVDLWDAANPNLGVTTPTLRVPVRSQTVGGLKRKYAAIYSNGGIRFGTAITVFCSSDGGATAVLTTVIPQEINVYYETGN